MAIPHRRLLESSVVSPPVDDSYNYTTTSTDEESTFDANMVIILAILLCCLIFVLGLNIFARYGIMRCILRSSSNNISSSPEPGLKKQALRQLPEAVFGSGRAEMVECSICLGEFVDGERVRVLPKCSHGFHVGCIDTWLKWNASCPNCRLSVLDDHLTLY